MTARVSVSSAPPGLRPERRRPEVGRLVHVVADNRGAARRQVVIESHQQRLRPKSWSAVEGPRVVLLLFHQWRQVRVERHSGPHPVTNTAARGVTSSAHSKLVAAVHQSYLQVGRRLRLEGDHCATVGPCLLLEMKVFFGERPLISATQSPGVAIGYMAARAFTVFHIPVMVGHGIGSPDWPRSWRLACLGDGVDARSPCSRPLQGARGFSDLLDGASATGLSLEFETVRITRTQGSVGGAL